MNDRRRIGSRVICASLIVIVVLALIPSATDTVMAQGTSTASVCQSITKMMPGLLQTAQRLRTEQDQYQRDLNAEQLALLDIQASLTRGVTPQLGVPVDLEKAEQAVRLVRILLSLMQE